jgi:MoaA/NifB/PqqE/SkfB family radical SAM enzyme
MIFEKTFLRFFGTKKEEKPSDSVFFEGYNKSRSPGKEQYACYAPLKNIYFGHHGKAVACCYNRFHVLGTYPEQSIKQIWFGEKAGELRSYLKNYDLSHGCLSCLTQIKAGNYDAAKAKQYDDQKLNDNKYPSVIEFELDNTCNLECVMCSGDFSSLIRKNRDKKPPIESPYDDTFIEQLKEFIPYLEEVKFYGGEPFMIPIYYKIWDLIVSINPAVRISIQTNATMLNSRIKDLLELGNFHINISLDSVNKAIYEHIRVNAKYEYVMANVHWLIDYCKRKNTFIGISACAMKQNWRDIPNILSFCNEQEVQLYLHTVFFPETSAIRLLPAADLNTISRFISSYLDKLPSSTSIHKKNKKHFTDFLKQVNEWKDAAPQIINPIIINTSSEFLEFIRSKLESAEYVNKFNERRRNIIIEKVKYLIGLVPPDFPIGELTKEVNFNDEFYIEDMLNQMETEPIENFMKNITTGIKS